MHKIKNYCVKWGSYGIGDWQFQDPHGIDVDSSGNVYVADRNNHRIQKFVLGESGLTKPVAAFIASPASGKAP